MTKNKDNYNTLDSYHKKYIKKFKNDKELNKLQKTLKTNKIKYEKLLKKNISDCDNNEIKERINIKNMIDNLEIKIKNLKEKKDESLYYLNTMEELELYYKKSNEININKKKEEKQSIMDFLLNKNKKKENNLSNFLKKEKKVDKKKIFNDYLIKLNTNNKKNKIEYVKNYTYCDKCQREKVLIPNEALYVCYGCGECNSTLIDSDKPSYKEPILEVCSFSYKRNTHFIECLNKFQALEKTTIPEEVYKLILKEIRKGKINDLKSITSNKMRNILKKINKTKYYDHVFHIINKINGVPPPKLTKELEDKMIQMFKQTQEPFSKICPDNRTNFLSYSYVIRKLLEILHETEYIKYFPLLKSREKLYQQDVMWKAICNDLGWEFKPSI
jgi:hypothetical protein